MPGCDRKCRVDFTFASPDVACVVYEPLKPGSRHLVGGANYVGSTGPPLDDSILVYAKPILLSQTTFHSLYISRGCASRRTNRQQLFHTVAGGGNAFEETQALPGLL